MSKARFQDLLNSRLKQKGLENDAKYVKRLKWETEEILAKEKQEYFLDLYDRKVRYPSNQNNLLVCWLLDVTTDHDIDKEPANVFTGEIGRAHV